MRPDTAPFVTAVSGLVASAACRTGACGLGVTPPCVLAPLGMLRSLRLLLVTLLRTLRSRWTTGPLRPSWSFVMELIVRYLRRDWDETAHFSFPRLRADIDARPYPSTNLRKVEVRDDDLGGQPARWFIPHGASDSSAILYFHGGSYIYGSARTTHADVIARLARATRISAVGLDYRLAPEHPYPAQLDDALRAFDALLARGVKKIAVAGDSAGGNLAIMLQMRLRDLGRAQAAASVLISPWSDLTMQAPSFEANDPYDYGTRDVLLLHAKAYAGGIPLDDPRLSPLRARLEGIAPTFVAAGSVEIPRDDILALAGALEKAGVEVTRHLAEDLPHFPLIFADYHPAGAACLAAIARFIESHLGGRTTDLSEARL